jgi:hypothetical protein
VRRCPSPTLWWGVPHFSHCWTSSSLQAHCRRGRHTHLLCLACLFTVCVGQCPPTPPWPLWWSFPNDSTVTSFPHSKVAGWGPPLLPSPAGLFIYSSHEGVPLPHCLEFRVPHPLCYVSFFFSCSFIIQFFSPWVGSVHPGGYADLSQGVLHAAYLLTWWSPKQGRSWHLMAREPSWFLCLMWQGDAIAGWGCGGVGVLPLPGSFCCQVYL